VRVRKGSSGDEAWSERTELIEAYTFGTLSACSASYALGSGLTFAETPLTACPLMSSRGQVIPTSIPQHVIQGLLLARVFGILADDDRQLDFVVHLVVLSDFWYGDDLGWVGEGSGRFKE